MGVYKLGGGTVDESDRPAIKVMNVFVVNPQLNQCAHKTLDSLLIFVSEHTLTNTTTGIPMSLGLNSTLL